MAWSIGLSPGSKILQQGPGHAACLGSNQLPALLLHLWGGALGSRWWGSPASLPIADRKCLPTAKQGQQSSQKHMLSGWNGAVRLSRPTPTSRHLNVFHNIPTKCSLSQHLTGPHNRTLVFQGRPFYLWTVLGGEAVRLTLNLSASLTLANTWEVILCSHKEYVPACSKWQMFDMLSSRSDQ